MHKARAIKPRRVCYFCSKTGQITKEHVWAQWMDKDVEVGDTRYARTIGFARTAEDAFTELPTVMARRQGSVLTTKVREVCKDCNSGWMSRMETAVEPLLASLWGDSYSIIGGGTSLAPDESALVSTWATKTAWMHERTSNPNPTPTPEMRAYLMANKLPPPHTSVWVGRHVGAMNFAARFARMTLHHQDQSWNEGELRRVLLCGMAFKGLAMVVRSDDGWGAPQFTLGETAWRQIWPVNDAVSWPPLMSVSDEALIAILTNYSTWARVPDLPLFHRSSTS